MQIEELNSYTELFDTYGLLLSKKQYELMDKYLNCDLSESELASFDGSSRQSVHDAISKAKKQLVEYESKCKFIESNKNLKKKLIKLQAFLSNEEYEQAKQLAENIIENQGESAWVYLKVWAKD